MRDAIKRLALIGTYTAAYYTIGAVAWLCDHETSDERYHL